MPSRRSRRTAAAAAMMRVQHQEGKHLHWESKDHHGTHVALRDALALVDYVETSPNHPGRRVMTTAAPYFRAIRQDLTRATGNGGIMNTTRTPFSQPYTHGSGTNARFMRIDVENIGRNLQW